MWSDRLDREEETCHPRDSTHHFCFGNSRALELTNTEGDLLGDEFGDLMRFDVRPKADGIFGDGNHCQQSDQQRVGEFA